MRRIKNLLLPFSLFLLAFILRLEFISRGPFHQDALLLAVNAQKTLETLRLHYIQTPGSPLTVIIAAINIAIFRVFSINDPVLAVNFMAAYFGALAVLMLFLMTKELISESTAVFSALFFMILPPFLSASVYGKDHALSIFFALLSVYLLLKYLKDKRQSALLIASGLSMGLCGSARPADSLIIIAAVLLMAMNTSQNRNSCSPLIRRDVKDYGLFILAFFIPLLLFYTPYLMQGGFMKIHSAVSAVERAKFMGPFSCALPLAAGYTFDSLSIQGFVLALFGLYILFLRERRVFFFLSTWFLVLFFYHGNLSVVTHRLLIAAFVPLVIALGYFFSELAQMSKLVKISAAMLFLAYLLMLFYNLSPALEFRHKYNLQEEFGRWVAGKTEKNAIIMAMDEGFFIEYYANRKTLDYPEVPITCDDKAAKDFIFNSIGKNLARGIPVYVTTAGLAYDQLYCGTISRLLRRYFIIEPLGCRVNEDWHHSCLELVLYKDCLYRIKEKP